MIFGNLVFWLQFVIYLKTNNYSIIVGNQEAHDEAKHKDALNIGDAARKCPTGCSWSSIADSCQRIAGESVLPEYQIFGNDKYCECGALWLEFGASMTYNVTDSIVQTKQNNNCMFTCKLDEVRGECVRDMYHSCSSLKCRDKSGADYCECVHAEVATITKKTFRKIVRREIIKSPGNCPGSVCRWSKRANHCQPKAKLPRNRPGCENKSSDEYCYCVKEKECDESWSCWRWFG